MEVLQLRQFIRLLEPECVFNSDPSVIFCNLAAHRTIAEEKIPIRIKYIRRSARI